MIPRELILLSHNRLPAQNTLMLGNEDVSAFLNGYTVLWHPAVASGASGPPKIASPYDHEQPAAGAVYAVPESPQPTLPEDWDDRVRNSGAISFRATTDRQATLDNLRTALRAAGESTPSADRFGITAEQLGPFFGLGFGLLILDGLFEAMEHENLIPRTELWQDVQQAITSLTGVGGGADWQSVLRTAAERLLNARESLYPVGIHLIDLCLLDEKSLNQPFPASFDHGTPLNVLACAAVLEKLELEQPDKLAALRDRLMTDMADVCGGPFLEREDAILPVESQLWNLLKGLSVSEKLLGRKVRIFGRKRFALHPQLPLMLNSVDLRRALLLAFDQATLPSYRTPTINWPSPDGKQVEAFTRIPYAAENPQTYFHLAHYLHRTIMQDHTATLAFLHTTAAAPVWYLDLLQLSQLAPVLGKWTTLSQFLSEVSAGEYHTAPAADEFHGDYLNERINAHVDQPVSWFPRHLRQRRALDTVWTLAALQRSLGAAPDSAVYSKLTTLEETLESTEHSPPSNTSNGPHPSYSREIWQSELDAVQQRTAAWLAERLLSGATGNTPGYLLLNPCSFTRRVALEVDGISSPLPLEGPLKACQIESNTAKIVAEIPPLGFAWIPLSTQHPAADAARLAAQSRRKLADQYSVRNEFFEAEVDAATGGLKAIRDHRTRTNRLGQQLVFNPGSKMQVKSVKITSAGPALGEIVSEGTLLGDHDAVLATYRQRFRAWAGRPILDLRIEIIPEHRPTGYPWHGYYGARFAWRDERATVLRGVNGNSYVTSQTRLESPDYLEIRLGGQSTTIFPGGLPFQQRHGGRMVDIILIPEGESAQTFDLAIGLDRDYPMQTALGMVTPVVVMPTLKGPPHVGASGWLFHLDALNLLLTSLRPAADHDKAVIARLVECSGHNCQAELRCVRDPLKAEQVDSWGTNPLSVGMRGDTLLLDVGQNDMMQVRVEFA